MWLTDRNHDGGTSLPARGRQGYGGTIASRFSLGLDRAVFVKVWVENATAEALTRDERVLLGLWLTTHLNVLEQVHREVEVGLLPREALSDWGQGLYTKPYFKQAWAKTLRHNHSKAFQAYMERVYDLSDPGLDSDQPDPTFGIGLEERARTSE